MTPDLLRREVITRGVFAHTPNTETPPCSLAMFIDLPHDDHGSADTAPLNRQSCRRDDMSAEVCLDPGFNEGFVSSQ